MQRPPEISFIKCIPNSFSSQRYQYGGKEGGIRYVRQSGKAAFGNYARPLGALESAFRKAGIEASFQADVSQAGGKTVFVRVSGTLINIVYIEGDSPAQAVRRVAAAVSLEGGGE
jgi:hypothetical protein